MPTINLKRLPGSILKRAASRCKGYGANYLGRYQNDSAQKSTAGQDDSRNKSRWANWLEWVSNK